LVALPTRLISHLSLFDALGGFLGANFFEFSGTFIANPVRDVKSEDTHLLKEVHYQKYEGLEIGQSAELFSLLTEKLLDELE